MINFDQVSPIFSSFGNCIGSVAVFLKIWKNYFESYNFAP
jgi:hypothetical protein